MSGLIPLSEPNFVGNEKKYVNDAVEQGWVSTGGAYITKFEQQLANYLSVESVAACQSGTAALHLALVEANINPGDVVLVPPLTFIAAVNPVKYQFARPVFIDCDNSFCIDPIKLAWFCERECSFMGGKLIYKGSHVKAIVVVHVFGNLADMEAIMKIAEQYNLKVIEDATEALGSKYIRGVYAGKYAGTIGDFGAFSFNGNKIITTGGGGAITSNKRENVEHMKYLSTQAKNDPLFYIHDEVGYNYRMTNLQAALGVAQMEMLPEFVVKKQENYKKYCELLKDCKYGKMAEYRDGTESNCWFYAFIIDNNIVKTTIENVIMKMKEKGIQTRSIWGLINKQIPYMNDDSFMLTTADVYSNCVLNLPCSTSITEDEIEYVAKIVKEVLASFEA